MTPTLEIVGAVKRYANGHLAATPEGLLRLDSLLPLLVR